MNPKKSINRNLWQILSLAGMLIIPALLLASQPGYYGSPYYPPATQQSNPAQQQPGQRNNRNPWGQQQPYYRQPAWPGRQPQQPAPADTQSARPMPPPTGSPSYRPRNTAPARPSAPQTMPGYPTMMPGSGRSPYSTQPPQSQYRPQSNPTPATTPAKAEITLEVELGDRLLYVQQSTVLTLRIISDTNLRTAVPNLPGSNSVVFKKLDGPISELRDKKIVNRYLYALTPLSGGSIIMPPVSISGETSKGQQFNVSSDSPISLTIMPVEIESTPWLPLQGLTFNTNLKQERNAETGKPITLIVEMSAIGATGTQLPSLESQLHNTKDFKVYRENIESTGKVSGDGRFLLGSRTETYTLIPTHGGKTRIPALEINWWNVITSSPEVTTVPIRQLITKGDPGDFDSTATDLFPGNSSLLLWIPIVSLFVITIGLWSLSWLRHHPFAKLVEAEFHIGIMHVLGITRRFKNWVSPTRRFQQLRQLFVRRVMPMSWRLWFCVSTIEHETDPEVWSYMVKFLAGKHYAMEHQLSMTSLGKKIADLHPNADPEILCSLMAELDRHLYGKEEGLDFEAWKLEFRYQLRPQLVRKSRKGEDQKAKTGGLLGLNPHNA